MVRAAHTFNRALEKLLLPDLMELILEGDLVTLAEILNHWLPADLAALVDDVVPDEQVVLLRSLGPELRTQTFEHLGLETQ